VADALQSAASDDYPILRQVLASREEEGRDPGQLEFDLTVIIAGLERVLERHDPV
jgi:hypothetical protein